MNEISKAYDLITEGDIIVYPTDTLYGFGVDATNSQAIKKLNILKLREQAYSIIVDSYEMAEKHVYISDKLKKQFKKFFPGPYTGIFKKKPESDLSSLVNPGLKTIGIRIPKNKFIIDLVTLLQKPIITTSVNVHGEPSLNNVEEIKKNFSEITIFTNSKNNRYSKGSTIVDFTSNPMVLLRKGDGVFPL